MSIARHVVPKRKSRVKNHRRRDAKRFARVYGSRERVAFVASLPCVALGCKLGPCENHHIVNGGGGRKADYDKIIPLCRAHHFQFHILGRATFAIHHNIDLAQIAAQTEAAWQSHLAPDPDDAFSMASAEEMGESHTPGDDRDDYDVPNGAEQ